MTMIFILLLLVQLISSSENENVCCVCFEEIGRSSFKTPCKHLFHLKCIKKWVENQPTCPICREDVRNCIAEFARIQDDLNEFLQNAARDGNNAEIRKLIQEGADITGIDLEGRTPLHLAWIHNRYSSAGILLQEESEDIDISFSFFLFFFSGVGDDDQNQGVCEVQTLLENYVNPNVRTRCNLETPLMFAMMNGQSEVVKILLRAGADVGLRNIHNLRAFDFAIRSQPFDNFLLRLATCSQDVQTLLQRYSNESVGAEIDVYLAAIKQNEKVGPQLIDLDAQRITWTHIAAGGGAKNGLLSLLPENINARDKFGNTPLMWAAKMGRKNTMKILLEFRANTKLKNKAKQTALDYATDDCRALLWSYDDLRNASREGDVNKCKKIIAAGIDVNETPERTLPALHLATQNGHVLVVEILLDNGANVNQVAFNGLSPIHIAVKDNNKSMVEALLIETVNINIRDNLYRTPLMVAAKKCHFEILKILLDAGADKKLENQKGKTALNLAEHQKCRVLLECYRCGLDNSLHEAVRTSPQKTPAHKHGNKEVAVLLELGANVNHVDEKGFTTLHYAARLGNESIVKQLLVKELNIDAQDNSNLTPLMWASKQEHCNVVKELLDAGANPNLLSQGEKAFDLAKGKCRELLKPSKLLATAARSPEKLSRLIAQNVDVDSVDVNKRTVLHVFTQKGEISIVKNILANKPNINARDGHTETALMLAAANGHSKILKLLTDAGADITLKNEEGKTACDLAQTDECVKFLSHQQKINRKFQYAVLNGNKEKVKHYRELGAQVNHANDEGFTALHFAANRSNQSILNFLLEEGANVRKASASGVTPLHIAAGKAEKSIIDAILSKHPDVNAADVHNFTPLMFAAKSANFYNVKILLEKGANPKLKNLKGKDALDLARNEDCIEVLMDPNDNLNESHPMTISKMRNLRTDLRENEENLGSAKVDQSLKSPRNVKSPSEKENHSKILKRKWEEE